MQESSKTQRADRRHLTCFEIEESASMQIKSESDMDRSSWGDILPDSRDACLCPYLYLCALVCATLFRCERMLLCPFLNCTCVHSACIPCMWQHRRTDS